MSHATVGTPVMRSDFLRSERAPDNQYRWIFIAIYAMIAPSQQWRGEERFDVQGLEVGRRPCTADRQYAADVRCAVVKPRNWRL